MHAGTAAILEVIKKLPARTQRVRLRSPRGISEREYRGPLLFDYVKAAGMLAPEISGGGLGDHYFIATGADGFRVTLALAEVAPRFSDKSIILGYEQDGESLNVGVRLIVPRDDLGGRSILGLADIQMRDAGSKPSTARPLSTTVQIGGLVTAPMVIDAALFDATPQTEVTTLPTSRRGGAKALARVYRGVRLYDLLDRAGIVLDDTVNEDFMNKIIVATSTDGYAAVIAGGEIEPRFMNGDIVIARDGDGSFRLVVPFDLSIGRSVKSLASIELQATG